ncbi:hypothetical protein PHISCL_01676 [Aspergillus sclerotialis]|uniref:Mitochondrial import inner membrane translocase subunit TIM22 n=1 Tax=Aspergillus sclerotialis TaxID=2070753 RepID=A0A3A3A9G4_9EURO|nr:hypothetical protein PHISCL_01676 [Aspergillus sclerotialis]
MAFPGMTPPMGGMPGGSGNDAQGLSNQDMALLYYSRLAAESCASKTVMSGVAGFGMGAIFGLFMSSMSYDSPMTPQNQQIADLPLRQQVRYGLKDMGSRSLSAGKNFGIVGALFAGIECCIEGFRAKNDLKNIAAAGCLSGGILGARAGPYAACAGCVGFSAFSTAIDWYMLSPSEPDD